MLSSWSSENRASGGGLGLGAAVAGVLAFHAKLDIGHDLKSFANGVAALAAQPEISGRLVQSLSAA